jgi:hypothetical protein
MRHVRGTGAARSGRHDAVAGTYDPERARWVRGLAAASGLALVALGAIGLAVTGFDDLATDSDANLLGLEVNPLQNLLHLVTGVAALGLAATLRGARACGWMLAIVYGAVAAYNVIAMNEPAIDLLGADGAGTILHAGLAVLGLTIALLPVRRGLPAGSSLADEQAAGRHMAG